MVQTSELVPCSALLGLPQWLSSKKKSACSAGDVGEVGSIPGPGRSPEGGHDNPFQCSCLENPWIEEPGKLQSSGSQRVGHD